MTNEDFAYFAALLDGEGSVSITQNSWGMFRLRVDVTNIDPRIHSWVTERFEGTTTFHSRHQKVMYTYWQNNQDIIRIFTPVLPFFVSKKREFELAVEWARGCGVSKGKRPTMSAERRLEIVMELDRLHKEKRS